MNHNEKCGIRVFFGVPSILGVQCPFLFLSRWPSSHTVSAVMQGVFLTVRADHAKAKYRSVELNDT